MVLFADRMRPAHSTNEGKLYSIKQIQPVSKRINPLESANALYSIRKSDSGLRASESSSAALVGLTLAELHGGSGHVARLIRGEAAFADRRHCSLISREDQIPAREGRHNNNDDDISAQPVLSDAREGGGQ